MKFQFDPKQPYQIEAVNAVVDLFEGQPLNQGDFEISFSSQGFGMFSSQVQTELGLGNNLTIDHDTILANLRNIQERNDLDLDDRLIPLSDETTPEASFNFSVEMETGTGKTYVYLRTIFELNRKYGLKKFIIVVPSVAIREGVLKNLEITSEHFRALFNNVEFEYFVYDAKRINRLRQFATSNTVQILVINIDAFRKNFAGTEAEQKSNVIYKESDKLSGYQPIAFIRATRPIVIIDEPQSVDNTEKAQEAIRSLNPLCTLRYSATHRNLYNLVYRLDPVRAYEMRLVKQIVVASVTSDGSFNDAYVKLKSVDYGKGKKPTAKVTIHVNQKGGGVKEKTLTLKGSEDLFTLSNEREAYKDGYVVTEISAVPNAECIRFNNGKRLLLGQESGGVREDVWRVQIRNTIQRHLDKELECRNKGIKVLTLFFIDKVANYRSYDSAGKPVPGKFALEFENALSSLLKEDRYKNLFGCPIEQLHNGYFAQDKKGVYKESREGRSTEADEGAFNLIMKDKERLLSMEEPLRFIFSHSALREGWDNPNVFQICTLNETRSALRKRQEIGRGLRLPVNQQGERIFDESLNKLLVVANESYDEFAATLQKEYEEDCGVTFGKVPKIAFAKIPLLDGDEEKPVGREVSENVWQKLVKMGWLDQGGRITAAFKPAEATAILAADAETAPMAADIVGVLESYRLERHIKNANESRKLKINKRVFLDPKFEALWNRIKPRTTYSVEYDTEVLVANVLRGIKEMSKIQPARVAYSEAMIDVEKKGVTATGVRESIVQVGYNGPIPDVLAYLQGETELTRGTLARILTECGRLEEFLINPQKFMDEVSAIIKRELHRLLIDGIKYEKLQPGEPESEWDMRLFEMKELTSYLSNLLEVNNSVFDAIPYESEVERTFAEKLDKRTDVKLFVKLPGWFQIETPVGPYNPDWAILKHDDDTLYLVRETKSTRNFEKLRSVEAEKIKCGRKHFESLGVDFDVVTSAEDV